MNTRQRRHSLPQVRLGGPRRRQRNRLNGTEFENEYLVHDLGDRGPPSQTCPLVLNSCCTNSGLLLLSNREVGAELERPEELRPLGQKCVRVLAGHSVDLGVGLSDFVDRLVVTLLLGQLPRLRS